MSTGAFSLDQLMELAGLAVSQAGELLSSSVTSYISLLSSPVSFLAISQGL